MNNIESLIAQFTSELTAHVRQSVLSELRHMSLDQLFALAGGTPASAPKAPKASKAPKGATGATEPKAPGKRGPGRPKKDASAAAAAPKKAKKAGGRLQRRSAADIQGTLDQIVAFVQANPGVRSEHITANLGLDKKELPRPIAEGLRTGVLTKEGQKRATQYFPGGGGKRGRRG
jgi:hypothetical protein